MTDSLSIMWVSSFRLAASIAAEENGKHAGKGVPSIVINPSEEEHDAAEQILLVNLQM